MNSKQRTYGVLGVDYHSNEKFGTSGGTNVEAQQQLYAMRSQQDPTKKALSASKARQSLPEELLEWLNGRPTTEQEEKVGVVKYPNLGVFQRELVGNTMRAFYTHKDSEGNDVRTTVYAYDVVGGESGSSGKETVVNLLSTRDGYEFDRVLTKSQARELAEVPEAWDDEWLETYAPSTSVDNYRITTHWSGDEEATCA